MFDLVPARTDQHYEALLELIYHQRTAYLEPLLDLIELTWEQFGNYFRTTGTAYCICHDNKILGVCWVKEQESILELIGLIVKPEYQGQGIGTQVLSWLEAHCPEGIQAIVLQVHVSNPRAKALYERTGYLEINYDPGSGFFTLRKNILITG